MTPLEPTASTAKGVAWSVGAAVLAAGFLIPLKLAVAEAPRFAVMTAMFAAASVANLAIAAVASAKEGRGRLDRTAWVTGGLLAVCTVVGNAGIAWALPLIGAGMTSTVLKAQAILTPVAAMIFLGETVTLAHWAGTLLALLGFVWPQLGAGPESLSLAGQGWALGGALSFSAMQIITRRVIHEIDNATVNGIRLVGSVVLLLGLAQGASAFEMSPSTWGLAALAGLLGPTGSRLCLMAALRHVSPSVTALISLLGPVVAFVLGWSFMGERPTPAQLGGAALILCGVVGPILPSLRRGRASSSNASRPRNHPG